MIQIIIIFDQTFEILNYIYMLKNFITDHCFTIHEIRPAHSSLTVCSLYAFAHIITHVYCQCFFVRALLGCATCFALAITICKEKS